MFTPLILSELDFLCNCTPLRGVPPCLTDILLVLPAALRLCLAIKLDLRGSPDSGSESEKHKLLSLEKYWQNFWWRHVMRHFNKNTTHISKDSKSWLSVLYIFWQWNSTCEGHQTRGQNLKRQCTEITDIGKIMAKFDERILNVSSTNKDFENSSLHF